MLSFISIQSVDNDYHKFLYNNLLLLNQINPPCDEFNSVFSADMFRKNNKKAFQQVLYYLFDVIHPEIIRQKIKTWPLLDRQDEDNFRKEVLVYIKELRDNHPDFNIPNILVSHLMSPGGLIFVKFVYKLSQFAIFKYLKRTQTNQTTLPIKYKKDDATSDLSLKILKQHNNNIKASIQMMRKQFGEFQENCTSKTKEIEQQRKQLDQDLRKSKQLYERRIKDCAIDINYDTIQKRLDDLQDNLKTLERIAELTESCRTIMLNLLNGSCVLKFDKNDLKLSEHQSITDDNNHLDLHRLFGYFKQLLDQQLKNLPNITPDRSRELINMIDEMTNICQSIRENCCKNQEFLEQIKTLKN